ncbi:DUF3526 domain-containing protein [Sphingomonas sp. PL-96]|uniref:DUF3526 domain-containing protein n=1 Tax=Sphingomonas sp. PL-96 TaxID=2887201 RepID=UPI001E30CF12|nr:DUF3526 domain-containing protein [Sphingomonas sp. PL-96]MCC2978336.1 DUF3526 domain-containing protein [Sphingomonas sp. PL-96]
MSGRLYRTELALLLRAARVRWIAGVLLLLIGISFALAWSEARQSLAETNALQSTERARWLDQDPKNPHSAAHYGQWLFKQPSPLAVLDPGVEPYVGRMMRAEAHHYNDAIFRAAQDRSPLTRAGTGTVADILHLVVPLAAILLGFSAFAVDRERGTLRLALGNGTAPGRLLAARFGALWTVLVLAIGIPSLLLGGFASLTLGGAGWQSGTRVLLWVAAEIGYVTAFLAFALLASLLARTARGALAFSLLAWALLCVAVPRLVTAGVETIAPTPSQQTMIARVEDEIRRYNSGEANAERQRRLLARYGVRSVDELPVNLGGTLGHEREQHDYAAYDRGLAEFHAALIRQDRLAGWAGILSPMVAIQSVSQAIAGTDFRRHIEFLTSAERYRRRLVDTMNLDLAAHPAGTDSPYLGRRALWERVPPYAYNPTALATSLRDASVPLAILAAWIVLVIGAAAVAARKVKP